MKKLTGQFRSTTWDPLLIISQITCLQASFYVTLAAVIAFMDILVGSSRSLDHLFKYQHVPHTLIDQFSDCDAILNSSLYLWEIHVRDVGGKLIITGYIINALLGSLELWYVVQRTKLCLDFSATLHLIHLLICWIYNGAFPSTFSWWLLHLACLSIMCVCGEFLCLRTELKAIPLKMTPKVDL